VQHSGTLSLYIPYLYMSIVIKHFARSSDAIVLFRSLYVPHAIRTVHYEFYVQIFLGNFYLIIFHFSTVIECYCLITAN